MNHKEMMQALLDGKRLQRNGKEIIFIGDNGEIIDRGYDVYTSEAFLSLDEWKIVEEPELELTLSDLGKVVKHRDGSFSILIRSNKNADSYMIGNVAWVDKKGKFTKNDHDLDIVEVVR